MCSSRPDRSPSVPVPWIEPVPLEEDEVEGRIPEEWTRPSSEPDHLEKEDEVEERVDITPPGTPSLPSSLPSSPLAIKSLNTEITELYNQFHILKQKIVGPHKISIAGIHHLKNVFNKPWKDKVYLMFYGACIPYQWITEIQPDEDTENPNIVHVYFLNDLIVNKVKENLEYYLADEYMEKVSIM